MNKKEARNLGIAAGVEAATYVEPVEIMLQALKEETTWIEAHMALALEAEENGRQYSPFESLAHEINEHGDRADGLWEAYDEGVTVGARQAARLLKVN